MFKAGGTGAENLVSGLGATIMFLSLTVLIFILIKLRIKIKLTK